MTIREPFAEIHLLITTDRSFHRQMKNSLYSSLYFEKIGPNVAALLTQTPISCAKTSRTHIFKNLTIVHVTCNDDIVSIIDSNLPLNMSLPKVYPFASEKNLIFTLEEEMRIQQNISRQTERTGDIISPNWTKYVQQDLWLSSSY